MEKIKSRWKGKAEAREKDNGFEKREKLRKKKRGR